MDSLITAAARALAAGDPLGALKRVALRGDAAALALRGIAMAQLGDLVRAKALLRAAARGFGPKEAVARARCIVAEAEIALVSRDLGWPSHALDAARKTLDAHGDRANAAHARYLEIRRLLLLGRLNDAERALAELNPAPLPPLLKTVHSLVSAGIAVRRLRTKAARAAIEAAERAARDARIPALSAEVASAALVLKTPAARLIAKGVERSLVLEEVETLLASNTFVVDACRNVVRQAATVISLANRPVLFALARRSAKRGRGRRASAPCRRSARGMRTNPSRPAAGQIAGFAECCAVGGRDRDDARFALIPAVDARSCCWRGRRTSTMTTRPCSRCWQTASRGRARRSRSHWEPVSGRCSARSTRLPQPAGCSRSGGVGPGAG